MDGDRVEGGIKNMAGKIEDAVGDFAGDAKTQASGAARQAAGQARETYGRVTDGARSFATENPLGAMLASAGVGLLVGVLLARRS